MMKTELNTSQAIKEWRNAHPNERLHLVGANLMGANLTGADLTRAYLMDADLMGANLTGADLMGANLTGAYLTGANLTGAYLTGANLTRADLTRAYLMDADLTGAYLMGAYLGQLRIWQFGLVGSRRDYLVIKSGPEINEVMTGCFRGSLDKFEAAVKATHGNNTYARQYLGIIALVREWIAEEESR